MASVSSIPVAPLRVVDDPFVDATQSAKQHAKPGKGAPGQVTLDENLVGANLAGASLAGGDLAGRDLSGADRCGANLSEACLVGAKLTGATLVGVVLGGAELAGADLRGGALDQADLSQAGFGQADLSDATLFESKLEDSSFVAAILVGADMRRTRAKRARFRGADLRRADFSRADLTDADLVKTNVGGTAFDEVDFRGARMRQLVDFEEASFLQADIRDVDFSHAYTLRRWIMDQNYLDELRARGRTSRFLVWLWWVTSDCGRSLGRLGIWIVSVCVAFGFAYGFVAIDYGAQETWLSPYYFSLVTLTTLGYGDVLPVSVSAQAVVMAEVVVGYMLLGALISIFSNLVARRAE